MDIKTSQTASSAELHAEKPTGAPFSPTPERKVSAPGWVKLVPFFLSAVLFFSGIFALFAPMPLLVLGVLSRRFWAWIALATNTALIWQLGGPVSTGIYGVIVGTVALVLPELLKRRVSLSKSVAVTLVSMGVAAALGLGLYGRSQKVNPISELQAQMTTSLKTVVDDLSPEARRDWFGTEVGAEFEEIRRAVLVQLPSALGILALALVWSNLLLLLRLNPGRVRERIGLDPGYFRRWKTPEWLVWPTIAAGALIVFDLGVVSVVGLNLFKFLLAVYALQGLSILSFFFDAWKIRGFFRSLAYSLAVFLMLPLLLSLGFFDLWFDFRGKLRQS